MGCPETSQLLEFADGALETNAAEAIELHLDSCPICRRLVAAAVRDLPAASTRHTDPLEQQSNVDLVADQVVDHFVVIRPLGQGGMGRVYLARDTQLGRKVALKVIHQPRRPLDAEATAQHERLLREAHATARFSHPNIVTIYAVGTHQGLPYLALEYLEGETLQQRAQREGFSLPQALRIGLAIARALTEAHTNGILHRDLKPANVMLTRDGRVRVLDFGLAKTGHCGMLRPGRAAEHSEPRTRTTRGARGTPTYMAPEQWSGKEVSAAVDVWAFGVILYELLCGHRPYRQADLLSLREAICSADPVPPLDEQRNISVEVSRLVMACLDKEASARPAAERLVQHLLQLIGREEEPSSEESPFRGLSAFQESHARFFYGRDDEIAAVIERLRDQTVLPIVGPSGAGKSSFVQAGLIPRLREQGELQVVQLRPGADPLASLTAALQRVQDNPSGLGSVTPFGTLPAAESSDEQSDASAHRSRAASGRSFLPASPGDLPERLWEKPSVLTLLLQRIAVQRRCSVLLFVDQLEEICTLVPDRQVRQRFMAAVCGAADDEAIPVRVVFTLREEFLSRLANGPAARAALSQIQVLQSPDPAALRETLTRPLETLGYDFDDPSLPDEMVAGVGEELASLPLLQFAGQQLWKGRDRDKHLLLRARYDEMGGVAGALARHADGVLAGLSSPQLQAARAVLLALITPEGTRRTISRRLLIERVPLGADTVIDRMVDHRLLTERSADEGEPLVELAHESLVVNWTTLSRWIEESHEELVVRAEVEDAHERWRRHGRRDHDLLRGDELHSAQRLARSTGSFPETLRRFINAGERRERGAVRRRRLLVALAFLLLAGVTVLIATKEHQTRQARDQAERGRSEALREGARAARARGDVLEARIRLRSALEVEDSSSARVLWSQLRRDPLIWRRKLSCFLYAVTPSPSGDQLAVAGADQAVYLVDVQTKAITTILRGQADQVFALAFTPDARQLVSATWGGELWIWDLQRRSHRSLDLPSGAIWGLAISPDGRTLAVAHDDHRVWLVDLKGKAAARSLVGHSARVHSVSFSADGRWLASASADGTARLWQLPLGKPKHELVGHGRNVRVRDASFSVDSKRLVTAGADATARIWEVSSGKQLRVLRGHTARVYATVFIDEHWVASAGEDNVVRIWDAETGREQGSLEGHTDRVFRLSKLPKRPFLASVSGDMTVRLWDLRRVSRAAGRTASIIDSVSFSPDDRMIAAAVEQGVALWDVKEGRAGRVLQGHSGGVLASSFSHDGRLLASASWDKTVRIYDLATGVIRSVLRGHTAAIRRAIFSPDDTKLITASTDGTLRLWNVAEGQLLRVLEGHSAPVMDARFSADGKLVASSSSDQTIRLWPIAGTPAARVLRGHRGAVNRIAFAPPAARGLYSVGDDGTLRRWDLSRGSSRVVLQVKGRLTSLVVLADGRLLYTGPAGVVLSDARGRQLVRLGGRRFDTNEVAASADGRLAATGGNDQSVRLFELPSGRPRWRTALFLPAEGLLVTHRGLQHLGTGSPSSDRRKIWQQHARSSQLAAQHPTSRRLCRLTYSRRFELWDTKAHRLLGSAQSRGQGRDLLAVRTGCLLLTDEGRVLSLRPNGANNVLVEEGVSAIGRSTSGVLVANRGKVRSLSLGGQQVGPSLSVDPGVTALMRSGDHLWIGYREGNIERRTLKGGSLSFEEVPSSAVLRFVKGPRGTVTVGFADGTLGIWSVGGRWLDAIRLHGGLRHLHWTAGGRLLAATELGDQLSWDQRSLSQSYCSLLREIWRAVPLRWEDGAANLARPPSHRCLTR